MTNILMRVTKLVGNDINKLYYLLDTINKSGTNAMLFTMEDKSNELFIGVCGDDTVDDWFTSVIDCLGDIQYRVYQDENISIFYPLTSSDNISAIKDIDRCYTASITYLKNNKLVDFGDDDDTDYAAMYETIGMEW